MNERERKPRRVKLAGAWLEDIKYQFCASCPSELERGQQYLCQMCEAEAEYFAHDSIIEMYTKD